MAQRVYLCISGIIFGLVSFFHAIRIVFMWEFRVGSINLPLEVSWGGMVAAGILAVLGLRLAQRDF